MEYAQLINEKSVKGQFEGNSFRISFSLSNDVLRYFRVRKLKIKQHFVNEMPEEVRTFGKFTFTVFRRLLIRCLCNFIR